MESIQAIKQLLNSIKKITLFLCLTLFAFGCQNDDEQFNPDDKDGDGVSNDNELLDGTDPNDPCQFRIAGIYYPWTNQAWKNSDCDGDGVTNAMELDPDGNGIIEDNITNPKLSCDLIVANQTLEPSQEWSSSNCDNDPFSNSQEVIDGTDIFDSCDFLIDNQDLEASNFWLEEDCDNDGRSNARELDDNTNLLDPTDFDGAGNILNVIYSGTRINYDSKHIFSANGTLYDKVQRADGTIITDFEYDAMNRLISVFIDDDTDIVYTFNYAGNQISQVTRTQGSEVYSYNVVYDGNIIYTYDGTEPTGLYTQKFTFNDMDRLISREIIHNNGNNYRIQSFEYDNNFENLILASVDSFGYNQDTQEIYDLDALARYRNSQSFSYSQNDIINPFNNAYQNILTNIIISSSFNGNTEIISRTFFPNLGSISNNFLNQYQFWYEFDLYSDSWAFGYGMQNIQDNGLPANITRGAFTTFEYEVHYE